MTSIQTIIILCKEINDYFLREESKKKYQNCKNSYHHDVYYDFIIGMLWLNKSTQQNL